MILMGGPMKSTPAVENRTLAYHKDLADPKQWLNFVQLDTFTPAWKAMGLNDDDLRALELFIMINPEGDPVIPGTGGLRKMRFAPESWRSGRRGAARVCYVVFKEFGLVALVYAYAKSKKDNLTAKEKRVIRELISEIREYLDGKRKVDARGKEHSRHGQE